MSHNILDLCAYARTTRALAIRPGVPRQAADAHNEHDRCVVAHMLCATLAGDFASHATFFCVCVRARVVSSSETQRETRRRETHLKETVARAPPRR